MTAPERLFTVALLLGALVALGGWLLPAHREAVGAVIMIGAYPVWCIGQLTKKRR